MNQMNDSIRAFIAIELPENVQAALKEVQARLSAKDPGMAKWVDPASIHLTLKFLGNVPATKLGPIQSVMQEAAGTVSPFILAIHGLGAFPNLRRVQIVWVGLEGDLEVLQQLQRNVETHLVPLGFPVENRPFTPHLTLARVREFTGPPSRQILGETIAQTKFESNLTIRVDSIKLMRSQLTRNGAIYTCMKSIEL